MKINIKPCSLPVSGFVLGSLEENLKPSDSTCLFGVQLGY